MATFVLNDETKVNSRGFRILNNGIDLKRFKANPVMLAQHIESVWAVIGKWVNLRVEGSCLLADAEFDMDDPEAAKIAGKVERGFVKACSMGLVFSASNMKLFPDETYVLGKTELMENSIVAVGSNANSLRLFAESGELLTDQEIQLSLSAVMAENTDFKIQHTSMEKITLNAGTLTVLGLDSAENMTQLSAAISDLATKFSTATEQVTKLKLQLKEHSEKTANALVDGAIAEGRLTADLKQAYVKLALSDYELAAQVIADKPAKTSLMNKVDNPAPAGGDAVKTEDDFMKLPLAQQLSWKAANPALYDSLFGE